MKPIGFMVGKAIARSISVIAVAAVVAAFAFSAAADDCQPGARAFEHAAGVACIPVTPKRIAALRDDSITTPLIDIGAPVVATPMRGNASGRFVRGASQVFGQNVVDALRLIDVGEYNQIDLEMVALSRPDLIIIDTEKIEHIKNYERIAPTIVIPMNVQFFDHMAWLAEAAGRRESFEQRQVRYRSRLNQSIGQIGDRSRISLSILDMRSDGLRYFKQGALHQVIRDLQFDRPAIQAEANSPLTVISFERIDTFEADVIVSPYAPRWGQTIEAVEKQWDEIAPFWRRLQGVSSGNHHWYVRDVLQGFTFESLNRSLDFLVSITGGRDLE